MEGIIESINELDHRPSWDEYFMSVCYLISKRSSCNRLHVGCVITKDDRIVTTGYNGHLPGAPHNSVVRDGHEQMTVHAESNAVADSAKRGVSLNGCTAYVTHIPCLTCTKMLIAAGIKHIIFAEHYNNDELVPLLCRSASVELSLFSVKECFLKPIVTVV